MQALAVGLYLEANVKISIGGLFWKQLKQLRYEGSISSIGIVITINSTNLHSFDMPSG